MLGLLSSQESSTKTQKENPLGNFEFIDANNWSRLESLSVQGKTHLIVAGANFDVRQYLPITLNLVIDGKSVWKSIIANDPKRNCRDQTGCSTDGPIMNPAWSGKPLELTAHNSKGLLLARYISNRQETESSSQTSETGTSEVDTAKTPCLPRECRRSYQNAIPAYESEVKHDWKNKVCRYKIYRRVLCEEFDTVSCSYIEPPVVKNELRELVSEGEFRPSGYHWLTWLDFVFCKGAADDIWRGWELTPSVGGGVKG